MLMCLFVVVNPVVSHLLNAVAMPFLHAKKELQYGHRWAKEGLRSTAVQVTHARARDVVLAF